ncbi:MAG TPA: hypothetical protein VHY34_07920 [Caulobacteraceae bacterium]|nr:hypothetical protein [Caulobacteraceae bacterium]
MRSDTPTSQAQAAASLRAVFLHGLWRSGSTYVWSRFRAAEGTCCYYEPLHDGLARLTRARIARDTPEAVQHNRHPAMEQPYFAEFKPLVGLRGVKGYQRRFAYSRFAPASTDQDPALEGYVRRLIDQAHRENRSPVLGFNRTGLRIGWLARRFDAYNIHIDRDPIDVFSSYVSQLHDGNHYYFVKWMQIIAGNPDYPLFRAALPLFRQPSAIELLLRGPRKYYRDVVSESSLVTLYSVTFLAWATCALHALEHSDLIMDIALADRPGYLGQLAEAVRHGSGLSVTFDDMHAPAPSPPLHLSQQRAIERDVLSWIGSVAEDGLFDRARIRARLGELSPRRAGLLARVI